MQNLVGHCRYCGTQHAVIAENQMDADTAATMHCTCEGAEIAVKIEQMNAQLEMLIGKNCTELGFRPVDRVIYDMIEVVGELAIKGTLQGAAFKVDGTVIKIAVGAKVKITRKVTHEQTAEI